MIASIGKYGNVSISWGEAKATRGILPVEKGESVADLRINFSIKC